MASENWFSTGFEKAREEKERIEKGETEFVNSAKCRFWVSVGQSRDIIFLDDFAWSFETDGRTNPVIPFCRHEYSVDLGGGPDSWKNPVYITGTPTHCKPAELNYRRHYVGAMTVLDITPFVDKETNQTVIRPRKRLLIATPTAMGLIERKKVSKSNLKGWKYSVGRLSNKDPRVGNDFESVEHYPDVAKHLKDLGCAEVNLDPYGFTSDQALNFYRELFAPMAYDEQERLFSNPVRDGHEFRGGGRVDSAPAAAAQGAGGSSGVINY